MTVGSTMRPGYWIAGRDVFCRTTALAPEEAKEIKKRLSGILVLSALSALMAVSVVYGYSGMLTYGQGQLAATGSAWAHPSTSLYWEVVQNGTLFEYKYILTVPDKDISHFILETSENARLGQDLYGFAVQGGAGPAQEPTLHRSGPGSPTMPGDMHGVKFDGDALVESTQWIVQFTSTRVPVWGDFYAKGGSNAVNSVFNAGFTPSHFSPTDYVTRDGLATDNRVAVPDTIGVELPELSTLTTGLIAFPAVIGYSLRRRRITK